MLVYSLIYMNEPFICNTLNMVHPKALSIYQYESNFDEMTCISLIVLESNVVFLIKCMC